MKFWAAILTGISELMAHKMRSLLTMLGVIFGIASVVAMSSIGAGARKEALEQIRLMGVDAIQINRKSLSGDLAQEAEKKSPQGLNYGDARAIRRLYTQAKLVVPVCRVFAEVRLHGQMIPAKVFGTTEEYPGAARIAVAEGRFLDPVDQKQNVPVCVIGSGVKQAAFNTEDPLGKLLRIGDRDYRVVGVMEERAVQTGRSRFSLRDMNQDVYLPLTVAMSDYQLYAEQALPPDIATFEKVIARLMRRPPMEQRPVTQIIVQVGNERQTWEAARVVRRILERRHQNVPDHEIAIPAELLRQSQKTQQIFNIVMGAIASISLLVGGIGIMNIMLATVTQRAREIGIRRCIGASRADITRQFLLECLVITSIGGVVGIGLGIQMASMISHYANWPTVVSTQAVVLSLVVATVTGVVFGLYPAMRAASIQPMEALRAS